MSERAPILIRRPRAEDAGALAAILADPPVARGLMQLPYAHEPTWAKRIQDQPAGSGTAELMLVAERAGQVVGSCGLHANPAVRRRHVMHLGISVAAAAQGQGVGTALMAALVNWADQWAGVLRLELTVYTDNAPAIALYKRFGFVLEGTHRAYALRDGVYADAYCMARFHPNPPQLPLVPQVPPLNAA